MKYDLLYIEAEDCYVAVPLDAMEPMRKYMPGGTSWLHAAIRIPKEEVIALLAAHFTTRGVIRP